MYDRAEITITRSLAFKNHQLSASCGLGDYNVFRKKTPTHIFFHISVSDV